MTGRDEAFDRDARWRDRLAGLRARVEAIRIAAERGDHEKAHSLEDRLRYDVLHAIAVGDLDLGDETADGLARDRAAEIAAIAASTNTIVFDRWCS